jgi:DNA phosphorothioation-associated putative methyltransferase
LTYPEFESDPHPSLTQAITVDLRNFDIGIRSYSHVANQPILHRKELFVGPDFPERAKFTRLTNQEERYGLFDDARTIGTRAGWDLALASKSVSLKGHRLVHVK